MQYHDNNGEQIKQAEQSICHPAVPLLIEFSVCRLILDDLHPMNRLFRDITASMASDWADPNV